MRELKAHLVRGADDRVRGGRDGKHFFLCVCGECFFLGKSEDFFLVCFCSFFRERAMDVIYILNTR